jgi:WD40 repeat protein
LQIEQAKRQIAEMHAEARAQIAREAASLSRASTSAASPSYAMLDAHMHRLDLASNEAGLYAVPATVAKSMPSVHVGGCHALAFDATGRWLASCGADKTVKVWDIAKGNDQPSVLRVSEGLTTYTICWLCMGFLLGVVEEAKSP